MDHSTYEHTVFADLCEVDRAAADIVTQCESDGKTVRDALLGLMDKLHAVCGVQIVCAGDIATGYCGITCESGTIDILVPVSGDAELTLNRTLAVAIECVTEAIETRSLVRFEQRTEIFVLDECRCERCEGEMAA